MSATAEFLWYLTQLYDAMTNAEIPRLETISSVTSTFAPTQQPNDFAINIFLNVFKLAFGLSAAGIWDLCRHCVDGRYRMGRHDSMGFGFFSVSQLRHSAHEG